MKIIFLGTPNFVQPIKEELAKHFTLVNSLEKADLGVIAAYGHILTKKELETTKYSCINVHPSLLPKYRGSTPIQSAILSGDKISGITIIKIDEQVDHGPILYQEQLELSDRDNFDTLSKKMFLRSAEVLPQIIIDFVDGKITPILQDNTQATYCEHLTRQKGYFDIANPPRLPSPSGESIGGQASLEILDRMIRAYYPWPGVWSKWNGKIVKFIPNVTLSKAKGIYSSASPQNDKFLIQMEGKKPISFKDFLNGYPDFPLKSI